MPKLKTFISYLLYLLFFLLPWQTRWFYRKATINGSDFEYGNMAIYATEILIGVILLLTIGYLWHLRQTEKRITQYKLQSYLILGISIVCLYIPVFFSIDAEIALYKVTQIILGLALMFAILIVKPDKFISAYALILASVIQSALAVNQFITQKVFASSILGMSFQNPLILGTPVVETATTRLLRAFGSLPHPNILAGFLVISLILIMGVALTTAHKKKLQVFLLLAFIFNMLGLLLTASKAGLITLFIAFLFFCFFSNKHERFELNKFFFAAMAIIVIFTLVRPDIMLTRQDLNNRLEKISYTERLTGYSEAWSLLKTYWLVGAGPGNYTVALFKENPTLPGYAYQPVHNAGLSAIVELGIFGWVLIITYASLLYYLFKQHFLKFNHSYLTLGYVVAAITLLFLSIFDHYLYSLYFGILLSSIILALAIHTLLHRDPA